MFGLSDWGVALAFVLTLVSVVLCVVWGIVNWNRPGASEEAKEIAEEADWEAHDPEAGGQA